MPHIAGADINDEIQLISDGDGLAVIGEPAVVDRFLASEGLLATRDFALPKLRGVMSTGAAAAEAGSGIAANSGQWVKLTKGVRRAGQEARTAASPSQVSRPAS